MQVLSHHIYEYKKGLRHLVLHTLGSEYRKVAEERLNQQNIDYVIQIVSASKINIFFGRGECVDVIRRIGVKKLHEYTPEEDFILGTMLGYDRLQQCQRYLAMRKISEIIEDN
ncbi:DUF2023 family protein [Bacteroidales bacterium OttesenSCG-928-B11]|nr:DUF2023 family protein [Bacteroidales bacterium OttesenSCG-928-C03]MDL2312743.1 DUF2023 family protein [Bacteroidales bacterium OttesenSCG-928-B11]